MANLCEVSLRVTVTDATGVMLNRELPPVRFSPASGLPKQEVVSLTGSAFTALSPPSGAKAVILETGTTPSLILKGVTGDSASITLTPSSNVLGGDHFLWLGTSPVLGLLNNGSTASITVIWL